MLGLKNLFGQGKKVSPVVNAFNRSFYKFFGLAVTPYDYADTRQYLDKGYNYNPDVYSVIKQISTKASDVPYFIKDVRDKKQLGIYRLSKSRTDLQGVLRKSQSLQKAFKENDLSMPLDRPNIDQSWTEFFALSTVFLKATGNCYWYIMRPKLRENAEPMAVYVLPAHLMNIVLKQDANLLTVESPIDYYKLIEGDQYIRFDESDVVHIKNPNPNFDMQGSHLYGMSDLRAALRNIQDSNEAIDNNIKTMKNGGAYGFIHSKGQNALTADQALEVKSRLKEMDADNDRLSKITGVSAELGFTRISLTTDELKPFDFLEFDQAGICNVLGWYTEFLNSKNSSSGLNNGALAEMRRAAITDTIMPLLGLFQDGINSKKFLQSFQGYENAVLEFDPTDLPEMQVDMEKLADRLDKLVDNSIITREEARFAMQYADSGVPELSIFTVSKNVMTLEDAVIPLENNIPIGGIEE
tara:strand:- start:20787 stop:22190 length:1404 start_codon:yes stop_codon:yes gene_type:complete